MALLSDNFLLGAKHKNKRGRGKVARKSSLSVRFTKDDLFFPTCQLFFSLVFQLPLIDFMNNVGLPKGIVWERKQCIFFCSFLSSNSFGLVKTPEPVVYLVVRNIIVVSQVYENCTYNGAFIRELMRRTGTLINFLFLVFFIDMEKLFQFSLVIQARILPVNKKGATRKTLLMPLILLLGEGRNSVERVFNALFAHELKQVETKNPTVGFFCD